jgi:four helix bundle protein
MAGWKDFREIAAWQHAHRVKQRVYVLLERPSIKSDFDLSDQLRRAARSAPANIAEGFGRFSNNDFARLVRIAKGSQHEALNHLIDARDRKFITDAELTIEEKHIRKAMNAATGLIRHLESTARSRRRRRNPEPEPRTPNPEPGTRTRNPEPEP